MVMFVLEEHSGSFFTGKIEGGCPDGKVVTLWSDYTVP
jgi:hypothetical protein